ncbi:MAG TPA: carboxypeptidase-like regulatory domain-containing protein, partial [Acidobacteriota bacterium]|nr:carboxypeptidase-like regulatory domain-containing protein [Acidobacteriota bacterium]
MIDPTKVEENPFSNLVQTFGVSEGSISSKLPHLLNQVAGWTQSDLPYLNQTQRSDSKFDELAEVLLNHTSWEDLDWRSQSENEQIITSIQVQMNQQLSSLKEIMRSAGRSAKHPFPTTKSELKQLAQQSGLNLDTCLDPWGRAYQFELTETFPGMFFQARSAGPDEMFSTSDDILVEPTRWYTVTLQVREKLSAVLEQAQKENMFWLSPEEFKTRAAQSGVNLDQMTDPWGMPLIVRVQIDKTSVQVLLLSTGPNRTLDSVSETPGDDFLVWHSQIIYSFQQSAPIHSALKKFILRSGRLPTTEAEFHQALALNGSTLDQFRDPMQHPFRVKFEYRTYDQSGNEVWLPVTTPVDPNLLYRKNADDGHFQISLISDGRDGQPGTEDDFRAFSSSLYEAIYYGKPQISHLAPMKHCMYGMVFDLEGKPLSDVLIVANPGSKNTKVEARSDAQGRFVIPGQSQGLYELRFSPHP